MPHELTSRVAGTVSAIAAAGTTVAAGEVVAVVESMKMEYEVLVEHGGAVVGVDVAVGDLVAEGQRLAASGSRQGEAAARTSTEFDGESEFVLFGG
jgi:biotin carboxyl carrier protein